MSFTPLRLLAFCAVASAFPAPQFQRFGGFGGGFPQFNTNDPTTQLAGAGALGTTLFAGYNCFTGNCDLSLRPNVGLNYDPQTGRLVPAVTANVQVGNNGFVNPAFTVGGQFDPDNHNGLPIRPVAGTALNIGDNHGGINPSATSNFAFDQQGQAHAQLGGGINVGSFNLGNPTHFFSG